MKVDLINHSAGVVVACGVAAAGNPALVVAHGLSAAAALGALALFGGRKPYVKQVKTLSKSIRRDLKPVAIMGPRGEAMDRMAQVMKELRPDDLPSRDAIAEKWGMWEKLTDDLLDRLATHDDVFSGVYRKDAKETLQTAFAKLCLDTDFYAEIEPAITAHQNRLLNTFKGQLDNIETIVTSLVDTERVQAAAEGREFGPDEAKKFEENLREILSSTDARKLPAKEALADNRSQDAADQLMIVARQEGGAADDFARSSAQIYREAAALYYGRQPQKALEAYREATRLDGFDFGAWIYLARLERIHGGNITAAKEAAIKARKTAISERDQSVAMDELGDIAMLAGDLAAARTAFTESLETRRTLAEANPESAEAQRDVSVSLNKLGDVALQAGDLAAARSAFTESHEILAKLAEANPESAEAQRDLAVGYERLGNVEMFAGDLASARGWFEDEVKISQKLMDDNPASAEAKRFHSVVLNKLGDVAIKAGDIDAASSAFTESLEIARSRAAANPESAQGLRDVSVFLNKLGDVAIKAGDLVAARSAFTESLEIARNLAEANPGSAEAQRDVWVSMWRVARYFDEDVSWQDVADAMQAMKDAGTLFPADEEFLEQAKAKAAAQD